MAIIAGLIDVSAKASSAMALSIGIVVAASAGPAPTNAGVVGGQPSAAVTTPGASHAASPDVAGQPKWVTGRS